MQAAKRRAITELLFFASVGDLRRCQRIVRLWKLKVSSHSLPLQGVLLFSVMVKVEVKVKVQGEKFYKGEENRSVEPYYKFTFLFCMCHLTDLELKCRSRMTLAATMTREPLCKHPVCIMFPLPGFGFLPAFANL